MELGLNKAVVSKFLIALFVTLVATLLYSTNTTRVYYHLPVQDAPINRIEERTYGSIEELVASENKIANERFLKDQRLIEQTRKKTSTDNILLYALYISLPLIWIPWFLLGLVTKKSKEAILPVSFWLLFGLFNSIISAAIILSFISGQVVSHIYRRACINDIHKQH
jgi:type IV secretory pathway VirB6-like protein